MIIGYARVSTQDQSLNRQIDQLKAAGCEVIFTDKASGRTKNRPEFIKMQKTAQAGDVVIITDLTRLGRSLIDLLEIVNGYKQRGIGLKSLKEPWLDSSTAHGQLLFTLFSALSEYERQIIAERTLEGLNAAKHRGIVMGRPKIPANRLKMALTLYSSGQYSVSEILKAAKISKSTLYNYLRQSKIIR